MIDESHAAGQYPVGNPEESFPLNPPLTAGDPRAETPGEQRSLAVDCEYDAVDAAMFAGPVRSGLSRWAQLRPPLTGKGLNAGGTPLLAAPEVAEWAGLDARVYLKDESRNPTWSHKDRLNRVTTSAALWTDADGIVAASTGNHGASATAHAARVGLPCVVFTLPGTPTAMQEFIRSYGAAVVETATHDQLAAFVDALAERGFHPVTSRTEIHTRHLHGPEGYKTIAYELYVQLDGVPAGVAAPTAFAELLYGVWKGFRELSRPGVTDETPQMRSCEPATQAALAAAVEREEPHVEIDTGPSAAHSIGGSRSTHRGYQTLTESGGLAIPAPEETIAEAQQALEGIGLWQEFSGAAGVGGLRATDTSFDGPVVALACSSGFKDGTDWEAPAIDPDATVETVLTRLEDWYNASPGGSTEETGTPTGLAQSGPTS